MEDLIFYNNTSSSNGQIKTVWNFLVFVQQIVGEKFADICNADQMK